MPKINREEYEVLKGLDNKWKWITRNINGGLRVFKNEPTKIALEWIDGEGWSLLSNSLKLFIFMKWFDDEPYNIAELIENFEEAKRINKIFRDSLHKALDKVKESEETEVKDLVWGIEEIKKERSLLNDTRYEREVDDLTTGILLGLKKALNIIDQLDEPEVLSSDWIKDNQLMWSSIHGAEYYILANKLYGKIVPKQEDINKEKQEAYVKGFEAGEKQTVEFYEEHESHEFNRKVNQLIKAIENPKRIKLRDVIERMDVLSEKNRNDWIERMNERYEVKEEQKYLVNILNEGTGAYLIYYPKSGNYGVTGILDDGKGITRFTEQEIKDYDPRYWEFRKPVEEEEE